MKTKLTVFLFLPLIASFTAPLHADVAIGISAEIRLGKAPPPPPPEVIVIEPGPAGGPPPWAPAHGLRRNRSYYYYPDAEVYYRTDDRLWFYLEGGSWRSSPALPPSLRIDFAYSVPLAMETDRPFDYHPKIITYYPTNYFVTRVRLKDAPGGRAEKFNPARDDHGPSKDDHAAPGKGKGNGKGKPH